MGRKNKRKKTEYRDRLGFNPRKYVMTGNAAADHPRHNRLIRGCLIFAFCNNAGNKDS